VAEPSQEQSEQLIEQLARRISRWRLTLPSLVFLEVAKPFSFIASQGLLLCQPFLSFLVQEALVADYADLLADRANIDQLMAHLEEMATRGENGKRGD
jgi:hypothetical protein